MAIFNLLDRVKVCATANGTTPPDDGGSWTGDGAFGALAGDNPQIDTSGVAQGTYTFTYTIGAVGCEMSTDYTLTIRPSLDAGTSGTIELCVDDPIRDLLVDLGNPPAGGEFSHTQNFTPDTAGSFDRSYTAQDIEPSAPVCNIQSCPDVTETITYIVHPNLSAGSGGELSVCG